MSHVARVLLTSKEGFRLSVNCHGRNLATFVHQPKLCYSLHTFTSTPSLVRTSFSLDVGTSRSFTSLLCVSNASARSWVSFCVGVSGFANSFMNLMAW